MGEILVPVIAKSERGYFPAMLPSDDNVVLLANTQTTWDIVVKYFLKKSAKGFKEKSRAIAHLRRRERSLKKAGAMVYTNIACVDIVDIDSKDRKVVLIRCKDCNNCNDDDCDNCSNKKSAA